MEQAMARIVLELTNRCNLRCRHCYDERHAATGDVPCSIVEAVLRDASRCGIDHLCFSGGEPTLHRRFQTIVERVCEEGYTFSLVTNGVNFQTVSRLLARHRRRLHGVTFSVDGADEATHDRLRGPGSYRQVMRAAAVAVARDLPFTFNCVLTRENRDQVEPMIEIAARLGSRGIRFGHLMFTAETDPALVLSPAGRRDVEGIIWGLKARAPVPVAMAPGYFSESPFFPCGPLELQELHVDHRGNLTFCCHLSGYDGPNAGKDVIGSLAGMSLVEACEQFRARVAEYLSDKRERVRLGTLTETDHFPCWYCVKHMGKGPDATAVAPLGWDVPSSRPLARRIHVAAAPHRDPCA
jgi:MoaA/NifB/PqqE/SkfB family radical SAM enzyme